MCIHDREREKANCQTDVKKESSSFTPWPTVRAQSVLPIQEDQRPKVSYRLNRLPLNPESSQGENKISDPSSGRFPSWLHRKMPRISALAVTESEIASKKLHTVCEEAKCPNLLECYSKKTATFLLLGNACTRACGFCDIDHKKELPSPDAEEPERISKTALALGLRHVVLTMVARDDLPDGGALHVVKTIQSLRRSIPTVTCEVLVSDFNGNFEAIQLICDESPEIYNHNLETVRNLSPKVRHTATYERSLQVLRFAKEQSRGRFQVKSGIMIGLGETEEEVYQALRDLHSNGVDIVTIGQYLQASQKKLPVREFVSLEKFERYKKYGESIGLRAVYASPFVRSSYNAELFIT